MLYSRIRKAAVWLPQFCVIVTQGACTESSDIIGSRLIPPALPTEISVLAPAPPLSSATPLGAFSSPVPIEMFSGADDPSLTADGLEFYFDSGNGIEVATRGSRIESWRPAVLVVAATAGTGGTTPYISPDGLELYFSAEDDQSDSGRDIYVIRRATRGAEWSVPELVSEINSDINDLSPGLSASRLELIFTRGGSTLESLDLFISSRESPNHPWGEPTLLSINEEMLHDSDAVFAANDLELWWVRRDLSSDLYFATRSAAGQPFEKPELAAGLNTEWREGDPWLSVDGRELVFISDRTGDSLFYRATR